ncbi:uncharacterized protein [Rutidosis leptorrhynchoides]|uniref:uncharacterized protein isoform X2 n=1 Tax=Rutidosis leptorrhynchoides TaxID=125765 RepID=UPI003A9980B3
MGHRQASNQFMIPGSDQHHYNHTPAEPSYGPMDHIARGGVRSNYHSDLWGPQDERHSTYVNREVQHHTPPFPRPPCHPYPSTSHNTSVTPMGPTGNGGSYKRKNTIISEGSSSSFYGAGSSSNSQMFRGSGLSIDGQDSTRNVRSRSELEPWMPRTHVPNYTSQYYQPITHSSNYSLPVHPVNLSADVASREWNSVHYAASFQERIPPMGINGPRHDERQFCAGGSSFDNNGCQHDQFHRTHVLSSHHHHVPHTQYIRDGRSHHSSGDTHVYRNGSNYCNTLGGGLRIRELHFPPENIYRGRGASPIVNAMNSHEVLGYESSFYMNSSNMSDEYQDMRLDIDDMSYEELLALEESIGHVNAGLCEDEMSKCLNELIYYSMDQSRDEASCSICLEEYKNGEKLGKMYKCGHEYHMDCIKKWLLMKKICPICKSDCTTQEPIQVCNHL